MGFVGDAISTLFQPGTIGLIIFGSLIGMILGALPGLSGGMAIVLLLPITFSMDPSVAIALLVSIYIGGISGGFISAILLGIPGTSNSLATVYDGYEYTKKGHPSKALSIAATANAIGTIPSLLVALFLSQVIARWAIKINAADYFSLALFAVVLVVTLEKNDVLKGLFALAFGLFFAMVGISPISATDRFTFGVNYLKGGFNIAVVMIGLFSGAIILIEYATGSRMDGSGASVQIEGYSLKLKEFLQSIGTIVRSFFIGLFVGFLPGMGGTVANMASYSIAKSSSKHPEEFGTGCADGVWAPEVANNASVGGALIPMIALGIPGDGTTALFLSAMMIQGVTTGPLLFQNQPSYVYVIFLGGILAGMICFLGQAFGMKGFPALFKIPYQYLYPVILVLSFVGVFTANSTIFDCFLVLLFIVFGIIMSYFKIPTGPFILAYVLGPTMETNFRNGVSFAGNGYMVYLTSPLSAILLLCTVLLLVFPFIKKIRRRN